MNWRAFFNFWCFIAGLIILTITIIKVAIWVEAGSEVGAKLNQIQRGSIVAFLLLLVLSILVGISTK